MNPIAEEMMSYFGCGSADDSLKHYGVKRRSGRYPWGSGDDPYQHDSRDFLARIEELKKDGWTETPYNIKKEFDLTTTQYRAEKAIAKDERRMLEVAAAKSLKEDGLGATEIARKMSDRFGKTYNESTVRSLLNSNSEARMNQAKKTAESLKKLVDEKGMIDVGSGVERELNISKEKLNQALYLLEREGYNTFGGGVPQATNKGQQTNLKVLCPPGTPYKIDAKGRKVSSAIYDFDNVHSIRNYISRDGETLEKKFNYPSSMDSKRLMIRYKEDGGIEKDGFIELRPGVPDLSLGESRYSQVRIMVDGKKYIKGMAAYGDPKDFPDGIDVIFNTNKSKSVPKMDVLKDIKDDPDNPFGSLIKDADKGGQYWYDPETGKRVSANDPTVKNKKLGLINKRAEEGDWAEWKDALPAQFLSKQSLQLAKKQLNLATADKKAEFDEICSLTNPTVKKHLLGKFADECDSAAVHLKAAALPGQKYHVIIPVTSMKDTEVYAPNYENGTKLALIRYPHGGTFEIPILTVNNKQPYAKKLLGTNMTDAIEINSKVAERLSGADFDGDTVMCIPTHDKGGKVKISSTHPLKELEGFDPKMEYPERPGMKYMKNTGTQMGIISNLITDMTLKGATPNELARAVRHSMVVIDAEKHKLDYKQSEIDNGIAELKKKYQSYVDSDGNIHYGGASTLISRSKSQQSVLKRQGSPQINIQGKVWYDPTKPEGSLIWKTADDVSYQVPKVNKRTGEVTVETKYRKQKSTKMAETSDAKELISDADTKMEHLYADYANNMKKLANQARLEMVSTGKIAYSANAKKIYEQEVKSLEKKLNIALLNAPKERQAQLKANAEVQKKIQKAKNEGKDLKKDEIKKLSQQALSKYREEVGSVSRRDRSIKITDKEWEAIQAGAISENNLKKILNNTDIDSLRERATPRSTTTLSQAKINQIKAMSNSNYTTSEIAKKLGVSPSTVSKYMKGVGS